MAGQDSGQSEENHISEEALGADLPETNPEPELERQIDVVLQLKRRVDFQEAEGFKKMASMAIMANLFQASTGRHMQPAAKCACDAAEHLWREWASRGEK